MNLNQTTTHTVPFQHWELENCLNDLQLEEVINEGQVLSKLSHPNLVIVLPIKSLPDVIFSPIIFR